MTLLVLTSKEWVLDRPLSLFQCESVDYWVIFYFIERPCLLTVLYYTSVYTRVLYGENLLKYNI